MPPARSGTRRWPLLRHLQSDEVGRFRKHMMYQDVYRKVRTELPGDALFYGMDSARMLERNWVENYELGESGVRHCAARVRDMIDALQSV